MSDESLITAVGECPVLYDLTLKVVFPVLPPATMPNAVDPHSPPGNHDRRRGIVRNLRCHGKKRYYSWIHFANCRSNQDVQVSDAIRWSQQIEAVYLWIQAMTRI